MSSAIDGLHARRDPRLGAAFAAIVVALVSCLPFSGTQAAPVLPNGLSDHLVVGGLNTPVGLALFPDGRMLCIECKTPRVWLLIADTLASSTPLLVVDSVRTDHNERGLLGVAVDARWPVRPYVYFDYTTTRSQDVWVSRYTVTGDLNFTGDGQLQIDPASRYDVLTDMLDLNGPHNGGTLRFGPDGMLYVSIGEDFTECQAQDLTQLGGKILRLDVGYLPDGPGGPPAKSLITPPFNPFPPGANGNGGLIWAYGLRNPFRFHIDMRSGVLHVVDVGNATYEEVDRVDLSGLNFGWPQYEGPMYFELCPGASTAGLTAPIYVWDRSEQANASCISAGFYRVKIGSKHGFLPEYDGDYFFSDFSAGWIRRLKKQPDGSWNTAPPVAGQPDSITWAAGYSFVPDFLEGPDGAIYYVSYYAGEVRKIQNDTPVGVAPFVPSTEVALGAPWPSPAHETVHFAYQLPASGPASLEVFDATGRRMRALLDRVWSPSERRVVSWDGRTETGENAPTGIYFARLTAGSRHWQQRFAWLR